MTGRSTDEFSEFDMRQLLLFEESVRQYQPMVGRRGARDRAAAEMPLIFDSEPLNAAVHNGDPLLPSYLAQHLAWVAQRSDWSSRQRGFVSAARDAHLVEAERRRSGRDGAPRPK
jgi:hypothetical protein